MEQTTQQVRVSGEQQQRELVEVDGWTEAVDMDVPAPPWVRMPSRRDPFPPCQALRIWPKNYAVCEMADLNDEEMAEVDPQQFVYSDAELEAWSKIVSDLLDETVGPRLSTTRPRKSLTQEFQCKRPSGDIRRRRPRC